jgi:hypothetical protein
MGNFETGTVAREGYSVSFAYLPYFLKAAIFSVYKPNLSQASHHISIELTIDYFLPKITTCFHWTVLALPNSVSSTTRILEDR